MSSEDQEYEDVGFIKYSGKDAEGEEYVVRAQEYENWKRVMLSRRLKNDA